MNEEVKKKRLNRKSKKLIIVLFFTMAFFVVITYAWFIGLSVAKVNTFEVKITTTEGLSLSLNGLDFYDEINLGNTENEILETVLNAYPNNPNSWLGVTQSKWNATGSDEETLENKKTTDLLPVSTNGLIDQNGSVLTLFSKSSMTSTSGGYSLTSDRYMNKLDASGTYFPDEQKGYISFNLFIKNNDNTRYINSYNMFNDEAVYLSTDSKVSLVQSSEYDGESTGGDGLENSLRIAFIQIGRVSSDSSQAVVTSITCETTDIVTGLCNAYSKRVDTEQPDGTYYQKDTDVYESNFNTFAIWEPNDLLHTEASKTHFTRICRNRTGSDTYSSTPCTFTENGYMDTYVVRNKIVIENGVDIYDGLNNYSTNTSDRPTRLLQEMRYYTDSIKKDGDYRNQLFMLAPNSITLVKVYIYLEGQDVDNYDIDSIGKAFSIEFGFTKDKYEDTEGGNAHIAGDINGDGIVDEDDLTKFTNFFLTLDGDIIDPDIGDLNTNGTVDAADKLILKQYINGIRSTFPLKEFHETFPDVNFRKCLSQYYINGDIFCRNQNIKSIKGIETLESPLGIVDLGQNRIENVDSQINGYFIDLSYNNLSSVNLANLNFDNAVLSNNYISTTTGDFSGKDLDLSYNQLENITLNMTSTLEGTLNVSHNNLWNYHIVYPNGTINMSYNTIGIVEYGSSPTYAKSIDLSHNSLMNLHFEQESNLEYLNILDGPPGVCILVFTPLSSNHLNIVRNDDMACF